MNTQEMKKNPKIVFIGVGKAGAKVIILLQDKKINSDIKFVSFASSTNLMQDFNKDVEIIDIKHTEITLEDAQNICLRCCGATKVLEELVRKKEDDELFYLQTYLPIHNSCIRPSRRTLGIVLAKKGEAKSSSKVIELEKLHPNTEPEILPKKSFFEKLQSLFS